jgi:hypothetical protein
MNDEWTPMLLDDPAPPEPDQALLARVVRRGQQRLVRRRAILGTISAAAALVLAASGVAVGQRRDASPNIMVTPSTTTHDERIIKREADANGLHYTIWLMKPELTTSEATEVALQVDNLTGAVAYFRSCGIAGVAISDAHSTWIEWNDRCNPGRFGLAPGDSFSWTPPAIAPDSPGEYSVTVKLAPGYSLPAALLQPLSLRVIAPSAPEPPARTLGTTARVK